MLLEYDLTVPANTTELSPATSKVKLLKGHITRGEISFPPGCAALVDVMVRHELTQIIPANPGKSVKGDNVVVPFTMSYQIRDEPFEVELVGWSDDDTYSHTITFRFDVAPAGGDDRSAILDMLAFFTGSR